MGSTSNSSSQGIPSVLPSEFTAGRSHTVAHSVVPEGVQSQIVFTHAESTEMMLGHRGAGIKQRDGWSSTRQKKMIPCRALVGSSMAPYWLRPPVQKAKAQWPSQSSVSSACLLAHMVLPGTPTLLSSCPLLPSVGTPSQPLSDFAHPTHYTSPIHSV